MPRVISVQPLEKYRLAVRFDDGTEGVIEMQDRLFGPVFEPLQAPAIFRQVFVDEFGAIAWPNGADLAPDAVYDRLRMAPEIASR
ncbi:MAG TPA: DUF2442 domain-containing protein [Lacipirellulaceae bacterium]|nr:DUF2442 domain-containing protein [Lacipirellulaceae bacterium]